MWNIFPTHVYVPPFPASYSPRDRFKTQRRKLQTQQNITWKTHGFEFNSFKKNLNMAQFSSNCTVYIPHISSGFQFLNRYFHSVNISISLYTYTPTFRVQFISTPLFSMSSLYLHPYFPCPVYIYTPTFRVQFISTPVFSVSSLYLHPYFLCQVYIYTPIFYVKFISTPLFSV